MKQSQAWKQLEWAISKCLGTGIALSVLLSLSVRAEARDFGADIDSFNSSVSPSAARIPRLKDLNRPAATVKDWLAQVQAATVQVTNVRVDSTDSGLEITLETADDKPLQVDATKFRSQGNSLIADIPNAVLRLPNAQAFNAENPTEEITNVRVVQQDTSSIRVTVTGNNALPKTEVTLKTGGLAYSLNPEGETPEEEVVVTGERLGSGYAAPDASTATRTDTPISDIPQSIQVVPQQVLKDQQVIQASEALRNVSGVQLAITGGGSEDIYFIRGFQQNINLRDGFRDSDQKLVETANLERIEVLKGPASVLYGNVDPGGVINFVTKQPLRDPFYAFGVQAGSFGLVRPFVDLSGPLNPERTLLYRLNTVYQHGGIFGTLTKRLNVFLSRLY